MFTELPRTASEKLAFLIRARYWPLLDGDEDNEFEHFGPAVVGILLAHESVLIYLSSDDRKVLQRHMENDRITSKRRIESPPLGKLRVRGLKDFDPYMISNQKSDIRGSRYQRLLSLLWLGYMRHNPYGGSVSDFHSFDRPAAKRVRALVRNFVSTRSADTDSWDQIRRRVHRIAPASPRESSVFRTSEVNKIADSLFDEWLERSSDVIAKLLRKS